MKILLTAFACSPTTGSEGGVGWKYACALAAVHDVWMMTDECRRPELERHADQIPPRLHIVYFRPDWLRNVRMSSRTAYLIFHVWMAAVWRPAQLLDRVHNFDLCWHLTYGTFRAPSSLWRLHKPLVIGPVGGGEAAPLRLLVGMTARDMVKEVLRLGVIRTAAWVPGFATCYRKASLVITRTRDTLRALPTWAHGKCRIEQEIGGWPAPLVQRRSSETLRLLFAGRLLALKGIAIGLDAFAAYLAQGGDGVLTIVGDGPEEARLKAQATRLGLDGNKVQFVGRVAQQVLFDLYQQNDVLLFPSLHDSGGNVVVEAMSFGMAVICLDLGGPPCFVNESCGRVISTHERSRTEVVQAIAYELLALQNPALRHQLSQTATERAMQFSYQKQIEKVTALALSVVSKT